MSKLSAWYDAGFRALWRHLKVTLAIGPKGQQRLYGAVSYCRTQYITALTEEVGPEEAQRIIERQGEKH